MLRTLVPHLVRTAPVRLALTHGPLSSAVIDRFVAGSTDKDAVGAVARLVGEGLRASVDLLGEGASHAQDARDTTEAYLRLLEVAEQAGLAAGLDVSVKLSALGQAVPRDGPALAGANAAIIAARAQELGATLTLDMEDHTTTDATLTVLAQLRQDVPTVGAVVQAQLRRTEGDCRDLARAGSRVRLCKGAYLEPAAVAHQGRSAVAAAYARCLGILLSGPGYPMIATHDPQLLALAGRLVRHLDRPAGSFEYQMLFGVRPGEQRRLAAAGAPVRVYLPYGPDCVPYLSRRLVEKPANLLLALQAASDWPAR
ncbi:proline dehydrogenase family protein [Frankia sp. R82]|uniref:proline dehydrogenase family protein n=1 Tax=Frankia sp. R82 TaxID=2950553 RepID=UPI002043BEA6|nr:proline dehydrogenase family protein [Frankia sp. R82]MCM3885900.1 proline dehydrogenase family protein [Frankia sp. R82]